MSRRRATKWLNKARRISNTISDLKDEDRKVWTRDYYSGTRTAVGPRFQNLGKHLKTMRETETAARRVRGLGTTSEKQYRTRARERVERIDVIEAEELASRILQARERQRAVHGLAQLDDLVWLAELAQDLRLEHTRIYEPGVETQLEGIELSIADIEGVEDLRERARRYGERRRRAPQILEDILEEADEHRAAVARTAAAPASPPTMRARHRAGIDAFHDHYDPDEGWGRKHKYKRTHKNKTKKAKKKKKKKKREK
jgi:hypothetical protein